MKKYYLAIIGLVFTTFIWGVTFELVEEALKSIPPSFFSSIRFFIASLCTFILILFKNRQINFTKNDFYAGFVCALFLSLGYYFQSFGLWENIYYLKSDPNKSAFITGTIVLMVPLILFFLGKGKNSFHLWVSIFIVLIGLIILLNPNVSKFTFGDILTFGCSMSFAAHIIYQGKFLIERIDNLLNFFFIQMLLASIFFTFGSYFEIFVFKTNLNWNNIVIIGLLITSVFATFVAILIMVWAQKILSPIQTAMIFTLEPVFAGIYNHFFTDHHLTNYGIFAGFVIVIGIMYHEIKENSTTA